MGSASQSINEDHSQHDNRSHGNIHAIPSFGGGVTGMYIYKNIAYIGI